MKWKMTVTSVEVVDALWRSRLVGRSVMVEITATSERDGSSFTWRTFDEPPRVGETVTVEVLG